MLAAGITIAYVLMGVFVGAIAFELDEEEKTPAFLFIGVFWPLSIAVALSAKVAGPVFVIAARAGQRIGARIKAKDDDLPEARKVT